MVAMEAAKDGYEKISLKIRETRAGLERLLHAVRGARFMLALAAASALAQPLQPTLIAGGDQGAVEEPRQPAALQLSCANCELIVQVATAFCGTAAEYWGELCRVNFRFSALRDECREVQRGINEVAGEFRACDAGIREGAALCGPRIRCVRAAVPDGGGAAATAVTEQQQL